MERVTVAKAVEVLRVNLILKFRAKLSLRKGCWVLISRKDELVSPAPFFFFFSTKCHGKMIDQHTA